MSVKPVNKSFDHIAKEHLHVVVVPQRIFYLASLGEVKRGDLKEGRVCAEMPLSQEDDCKTPPGWLTIHMPVPTWSIVAVRPLRPVSFAQWVADAVMMTMEDPVTGQPKKMNWTAGALFAFARRHTLVESITVAHKSRYIRPGMLIKTDDMVFDAPRLEYFYTLSWTLDYVMHGGMRNAVLLAKVWPPGGGYGRDPPEQTLKRYPHLASLGESELPIWTFVDLLYFDPLAIKSVMENTLAEIHVFLSRSDIELLAKLPSEHKISRAAQSYLQKRGGDAARHDLEAAAAEFFEQTITVSYTSPPPLYKKCVVTNVHAREVLTNFVLLWKTFVLGRDLELDELPEELVKHYRERQEKQIQEAEQAELVTKGGFSYAEPTTKLKVFLFGYFGMIYGRSLNEIKEFLDCLI